MLKKILSIVLGILFTAITCYGLFVCMVAGIAPLNEEEMASYMIKAGIFSVLLPVSIYGFGMLAWHYGKMYEQMTQKVKELEAEVNVYQSFIQLKKEYAKKEKKKQKLSVPQLSAALEIGRLSEEDVKELLEYLEEL